MRGLRRENTMRSMEETPLEALRSIRGPSASICEFKEYAKK
jgi:hypothetical protein